MNTNIHLCALLMGIAGTVGTSQSVAGSPAPKAPDGPTVDFVKADKNGNGSVSKEEALLVADLTSAFEMLDSDRDELISPTEFSRWSRAGKVEAPRPSDPSTLPSGSAGGQHMPKQE